MSILKSLFGPSGEEISPVDLKKRIEQDDAYTIIDVRTSGEYAGGSIPSKNTVNVEMTEVYQYIADNEIEGDIYLVCASGSRSSSVQRMLAMQGVEAVNVSGGMMGWQMM